MVLLLGFLVALHCSAQTQTQDSLKHHLRGNLSDTSRAKALSELSFTFLRSKSDTAMLLALEGYELSKDIGYKKGMAMNLNRIGNVYTVFSNYPKAMDAYIQGLKISEELNYHVGQGSILNNLGRVYLVGEMDYRIALNYLFKADTLFRQVKDTGGMMTASLNIATCYLNLAKYDSASQYAILSYNLAKKINFIQGQGGPLTVLGAVNYHTKHYGIALGYCKESLPLLEYIQDYYALSLTYLITAKIFAALQQNDSSLYYARKAFAEAAPRGFHQKTREVADFLSSYYRNRNIDSAFYYQDLSKSIGDTIFNQTKQRAFQNVTYDEKLRQQEIANKKTQEEEDRKHRLQYIAIVVALIFFVVLFFLFSRTIVVGPKFINFFGILGLLAVFEFINLFLHPWLEHITHHSPILMLAILMGIAALLIPLHHKLEHWITHKMIEANNKIRLAAAKKTIAELEEIDAKEEPGVPEPPTRKGTIPRKKKRSQSE